MRHKILYGLLSEIDYIAALERAGLTEVSQSKPHIASKNIMLMLKPPLSKTRKSIVLRRKPKSLTERIWCSHAGGDGTGRTT